MSTPGSGPGGPVGRPTEQVPPGPRPDAPTRVQRRDTAVGRAVDAKTSSVERNELPRDLPDLDKIHHVSAVATAEPATSGPAVGTVGPYEVGAANSTSSTSPARAAAVRASAGPVRASMQLRHIDPWSTFKLSLVVSVVLFFVWMIAVGALYIVLDGMGVWARLNNSFSTLVNDQTGASLVSSGDVFGWAALVGVAYVVLFTALFTVGAFIYNLCSELVGGVEVTLADRD